jgi:hypothetical protein
MQCSKNLRADCRQGMIAIAFAGYFANQKFIDEDLHNYYFACCMLWV